MKRRSFIKAFPFVGAAVALPVSSAEGMYLDAETSALVANWQRLIRERQALEAEIKESGIRARMEDHPILGRLNCLYQDENEAQHAVIRALRKAGA